MTRPTNYQRMAKVIGHLQQHFQQQPQLDELARSVGLSPAHFQRQFRQWCGLSPKQFLQSITTDQARQLLSADLSTLEASLELGLSGSSRLYDHLVTIEAVSPGEMKSAGRGLDFFFGVGVSPLGRASISWTQRGVHTLRFLASDMSKHPDDLMTRELWSQARWHARSEQAQVLLDDIFSAGPRSEKYKLWVKGTNFQIAVWRALLAIPEGEVCSYNELSKAVGKLNASRAAGRAIGTNPIAVLIPCHRVIKTDGNLGGYRWGLQTKKLLLAKELIVGRTDNH